MEDNLIRYRHTCSHCHKDFISASPGSRFCSEGCRLKNYSLLHGHLSQKGRNSDFGISVNSLQHIASGKASHYETAKREAIARSPDISKMQIVSITSKTSILIKQGQNIREAKANFIAKMQRLGITNY
jgi:hypothetical protein